MVICTAKAEKMREFVEAQRQVQRQKFQLKFEGMQLKEAVSLHWATVFLHCTQNTWCIFNFEVWFRFTRMAGGIQILMIKSLTFLPSLKVPHGFKYIFLVLLRYEFS